jgi:hypothetical protein
MFAGGWVENEDQFLFNPVPTNPATVDFVTILPAAHLVKRPIFSIATNFIARYFQ